MTAHTDEHRPSWASPIHRLRGIPKDEFWYLATPYTKYPLGIEAAFRHAARVTAALAMDWVPVFSPICHTHPVAIHGGIDPYEGARWVAFDAPMMANAYGLLIAPMQGWQDSVGIQHERMIFAANGKRIEFLPQEFVEAALHSSAETAG